MLKSIGYKFFIAIALMLITFSGARAQDNGSQSSNQNTVKQDPFVPVASKLAQTLQSRVNLDDDQMQKIRDLLIQYNSKVRDLQGIQLAANRDMDNSNRAAAKSKTGKTETTPRDKTGTTTPDKNDNTGKTSSGGFKADDQSDIAANLRDNDIDTNKDIEDVLNDNQKSAWLNEKSSWWQNVKQEVYSGGKKSINTSEQGSTENPDNSKPEVDKDRR